MVLAAPELLLSLAITNLLLSQPSQAGGQQEGARPASLGMSAEESRRDSCGGLQVSPLSLQHTQLHFEFPWRYLDGHCPSFLITS